MEALGSQGDEKREWNECKVRRWESRRLRAEQREGLASKSQVFRQIALRQDGQPERGHSSRWYQDADAQCMVDPQLFGEANRPRP